jgi:catechol 2,3-dioxygenase-like lactoylglutathione lyase family enzyme
MTHARFKALCIDAADALALAAFWQRMLDARLVDHGDGSARLECTPEGPGDRASGASANTTASALMWVDPVPEPRTGGTRVHLDLRLATPDPAPLLAAGARLRREPGGDIHWWVLADPEGNEFCAMAPRAGEPPGPFELVVAAADPMAQARWWAAVVGGAVDRDGAGAYIEGGAAFPFKYWVFDSVPEPKAVKNRMHWDITLTADTPDALVTAGAVVRREPGGDIRWWVLTDPEGNEFCAFPPSAE